MNLPWRMGRGLATVYKSKYTYWLIPADSFSSFELQTFLINLDSPVLCALMYRPPKFNKDFIQDFTNFVTNLLLRHDHFLVVGDFSIHTFCKSKPLAKEFLNLTDSFNLTPDSKSSVLDLDRVCPGPGHSLNLMLSFGLNSHMIEICEAHFSEHFAVLFSVTLSHSVIRPCTPACVFA